MTADVSHDLSWQARGACHGTDPDLWFPDTGDNVSPEVVDICGRCPVRPACLAHALLHERHGVWAATSEAERQRRRARAS